MFTTQSSAMKALRKDRQTRFPTSNVVQGNHAKSSDCIVHQGLREDYKRDDLNPESRHEQRDHGCRALFAIVEACWRS